MLSQKVHLVQSLNYAQTSGRARASKRRTGGSQGARYLLREVEGPDDAAATIEGAAAQFLGKEGAFTLRAERIALSSIVPPCAKS